MLYRGVIRDGRVEFTGNVRLPEGTPVKVERANANKPAASKSAGTRKAGNRPRKARPRRGALSGIKAWDWGASDAAEFHTEYATGRKAIPGRTTHTEKSRRRKA